MVSQLSDKTAGSMLHAVILGPCLKPALYNTRLAAVLCAGVGRLGVGAGL